MYAEDLTFWDQTFIVAALMFVFVGAFYLGLAIKEKEIEEARQRREIEDAAHKQAIEGRQGYRKTDVAA